MLIYAKLMFLLLTNVFLFVGETDLISFGIMPNYKLAAVSNSSNFLHLLYVKCGHSVFWIGCEGSAVVRI